MSDPKGTEKNNKMGRSAPHFGVSRSFLPVAPPEYRPLQLVLREIIRKCKLGTPVSLWDLRQPIISDRDASRFFGAQKKDEKNYASLEDPRQLVSPAALAYDLAVQRFEEEIQHLPNTLRELDREDCPLDDSQWRLTLKRAWQLYDTLPEKSRLLDQQLDKLTDPERENADYFRRSTVEPNLFPEPRFRIKTPAEYYGVEEWQARNGFLFIHTSIVLADIEGRLKSQPPSDPPE